VAGRDIVVRVNEDAEFAIPFCDGYWSRLLNLDITIVGDRSLLEERRRHKIFVRRLRGELRLLVRAHIEPAVRRSANACHEASPDNAKRLATNALLERRPFRRLNAAVSEKSGRFARITGARHEAFGALLVAEPGSEAMPVVSLDDLAADGLIDPALPVVIKLDVEGVEIEALTGAACMCRPPPASGASMVRPAGARITVRYRDAAVISVNADAGGPS
jgi:FkbM family methyltransferase